MYKIQVKIGGSWLQLETANLENVSITKAIENGHIFARITVGGNLIFYSDDFNTLFNNITSVQLEGQIYRTEPTATGVASGYLNLYGLWDFDRKVCELSFNVVDDYTMLFERWDEKDVTAIYYDVASVIVDSETVSLSIPATSIPGTGSEHNWVYDGQTPGYKHYKKQLIEIPAPLWDCDEVLPTETSTIDPLTGEYLFPVYRNKYSRGSKVTQTVIRPLSYFLPVFDLLEQYLTNVNISINTATYCPYFSRFGLENVMFAQKSRVLDNEAVASSKIPSLKELLEIYKILFNLDWLIENDYLYFKHPDERQQTTPSFITWPKHDLTNITGQNWAAQLNKLQYKTDEQPFKEVWNVERTNDLDFNGKPIRYTEGISQNQIEYEMSNFQTNLKAVLVAGDAESIRKEDISDDGFVVVACDGSNNIINETGILAPESEHINGKLALTKLHYNHHRTGDRYFSTGEMNEIQTAFTNIRKKTEVTFKLPAFITDFSFDHLVKTGFGNMKIISITEYCSGKLADLKLEY